VILDEWLTRDRSIVNRLISANQIVNRQSKIVNAMDEWIIRPFHADDQCAARALILSGLGEHFGFIDETLNPDLDDISAHYVQPGLYFVVAQAGQRLIGTGALMWLDAQTAQMVRVSVHPDMRKRGLGRAIVAYLVDIARQRRMRRVQVETNLDWYDAIRLYEHHGFHEYDRDDVSVYLALELDPGSPDP
jgi:GNAT superfamily N-acetyltransferase